MAFTCIQQLLENNKKYLKILNYIGNVPQQPYKCVRTAVYKCLPNELREPLICIRRLQTGVR